MIFTRILQVGTVTKIWPMSPWIINFEKEVSKFELIHKKWELATIDPWIINFDKEIIKKREMKIES